MNRYFIEFSYNGANYSGWQTQNNAPSVQSTLKAVLEQVCHQKVGLVGSSRTDAGVHALKQVAQLDFSPALPLSQLVFKLNQALPADIAVSEIYPVKPESKARYDALSRKYQYLVVRKKNPFYQGRALYFYGQLDLNLLKEACLVIKKYNDFQAFSKIHTHVNHFNCHISEAEWKVEGDLLCFEIRANRFLRGMVRALVGTMLDVARGRISLTEFEEIIKSKDRKKAGENAPAHGLYLVDVAYPSSVKL